MKNKDTILKRERKLLKRENYYRRVRHVSIWSGVGVLILSIVFSIVYPSFNDETSFVGIFPLILICFGIGYEAHLRLLHIDSIHYHTEFWYTNSENNKETT